MAFDKDAPSAGEQSPAGTSPATPGKRSRSEGLAVQRRTTVDPPSRPAGLASTTIEGGSAGLEDPFAFHVAPGRGPAGAIQGRSMPSADDPAQVTRAAEDGVAGGGGTLPHLGTIQQAFGHHDVSSVRAHTDDRAAAASRSIGAVAYATGNEVAFAEAPSLHTAAHEAAHVVQQRAGVHLKGGVGEAGDHYEQHADLVADRVVRGESAVELLDGLTGGPQATPRGGGAVQRRGYEETKSDGYQQALYERKAEEYEFKLGYALSKHPVALEGAKALTDGVKTLMEETEAELNLSRTSMGKVDKTRQAEIFTQGNLRERMGALYSAVTSGGLSKMLDAGAKANSDVVDKDLVEQEQANAPKDKWRGFDRTGRVNDRQDNDRALTTEKEQSKHLDSFFGDSEAPTANKVKARGEQPLSTRELESLFPRETTKVKDTVGGQAWNLLDEEARANKYLERVGDLPLGDKQNKNWSPGSTWYKLGDNLKEEGKSKNMRMVSGLSGSTDMYLHLAKYLKVDQAGMEKVRAAALGTMIPARDHSYHEIMVASTGYGLDYADGVKGAGYAAFRPFNAEDLKTIAGVPVLPNEYLSDRSTNQIANAVNNPGQVLTARVPERSELPKVGWKAKIQRGKSAYEQILALVDRYHAAAPADRFGIADGIVGAVDQWMTKNNDRGHGGDDDKRGKLAELRARALQAGTDALVHKEGQQAMGRLTVMPDEDDEDGAMGTLAGQDTVTQGLTPQGAVALEKLDKRIDAAVAQADDVDDESQLPALRASPIFATLKASAEFLDLVAAMEADRAARIVIVLLNAKGHGKLVKKLAVDDADLVAFAKEATALTQVLTNFTGVDVNPEDVKHPRRGRFRLEGGEGGIRQTLQGARGLSPEELDAINGYTGLEYKAFNDNTVAPERRAALISALHKLPKKPAPLYRGDYSRPPRRGETKSSDAFTSTGSSLEDSFISVRPTAHVYISAKSAANIEGLSKKTWEREGLFPPTTWKVVAVVNKRATRDRNRQPTEAIKSEFDQDTHKLTGKHGMPTRDEQRQLGNRAIDFSLNVGLKDDDEENNEKVAEWYTEKFSDKTWVFWEEV